MKPFILIVFISCFFFVGCSKDGCNKRSKIEASFAIQDSSLIPISQEWVRQDYTLLVTTCEKNSEWIEFENFANEGIQIAGIKSGTSFTVEEENLTDSNWKKVSGSGTICNETMTLEYALTNSFGEVFIGSGNGSEN